MDKYDLPRMEIHGFAMRDAWSVVIFFKRRPLLVLIAVLVLVGATSTQYFLSPLNLQNLLRSISGPGLLALGVTVVLLTGRIDLSIGPLMVFSPMAAVYILSAVGSAIGQPVLQAGSVFTGSAGVLILATFASGIASGLFSGVGVIFGRIPSLIMTLAMMEGLQGLCYVISNGNPFYLQMPSYTWIGNTNILGIPVMFIVYGVVSIGLAIALRLFVFGRRVYAIGGNERSAMLAGINTKFWIIAMFCLSGALCALAGILITSRAQAVDVSMSADLTLQAIAFTVVGGVGISGGKGSPYDTFVGTVSISILLNLLTLWGISSWFQNLVVGLIVVAVVALGERGARGGVSQRS